MKRFRDLPIGRKLTLAMMLTGTAAVLLAGVIRIFYEVAAFRDVTVRDLSVQASIIGENCAATTEFNNPRIAVATLASLKARTDIVAACVYRQDGSILAGYHSGTNTAAAMFPPMEADGHRVEDRHLLLFHRIIRRGEPLGTVYLRSNLQVHYARLDASIAIALGMMLVAWILSWALAAGLQRIIAAPILDLAKLAEQVRHRQNYSLRADKRGDDEIGALTDGFNRMLENIQERDVKLHRAYDNLQVSEQRFRQLAEAISAVFWITDPSKSQMIYVSPGYDAIWGRSRNHLYKNPRSWLEAIHPEDCERVERAALTKQVSGSYDEEYRIVRPDGSIRWIRDRAFPINDKDGNAYRIVGIAEDITERRETEEALRRLSVQLLQSQDEERRRIALELHDVTGQKLVVASMRLSMMNKSTEPLDSETKKTHAECLALLDECLREIRTLSYLLHPPLFDECGLPSTLRWYVDGFTQRSGIQVDLEVSPDLRRLPQETEMALFRIVQEGLTNTHRHSGSLMATIRLTADHKTVRLELSDTGKGFPTQRVSGLPDAMGVGITGLRERVRQLGGNMSIQSSAHGTTIQVILPLSGVGS